MLIAASGSGHRSARNQPYLGELESAREDPFAFRPSVTGKSCQRATLGKQQLEELTSPRKTLLNCSHLVALAQEIPLPQVIVWPLTFLLKKWVLPLKAWV